MYAETPTDANTPNAKMALSPIALYVVYAAAVLPAMVWFSVGVSPGLCLLISLVLTSVTLHQSGSGVHSAVAPLIVVLFALSLVLTILAIVFAFSSSVPEKPRYTVNVAAYELFCTLVMILSFYSE